MFHYYRAPARLIADNSGVEGEVIVQQLLGKPFEMGYNAMDDRIENLIEAGIIDPAKVRHRFLRSQSRVRYQIMVYLTNGWGAASRPACMR